MKKYNKPIIIEEVVEIEDIIATSSEKFDTNNLLTGNSDKWYPED